MKLILPGWTPLWRRCSWVRKVNQTADLQKSHVVQGGLRDLHNVWLQSRSWLSGYCKDLGNSENRLLTRFQLAWMTLRVHNVCTFEGVNSQNPLGCLQFSSLPVIELMTAGAGTGCSRRRWHNPEEEQRSCSSCSLHVLQKTAAGRFHHRHWTSLNCLRIFKQTTKICRHKRLRQTKIAAYDQGSTLHGFHLQPLNGWKAPHLRCDSSNSNDTLNPCAEEVAGWARERGSHAVLKVPNECCQELPDTTRWNDDLMWRCMPYDRLFDPWTKESMWVVHCNTN